MTRRRIIDPGTTWALSRRTTRRHFLLNPDESRQMEGRSEFKDPVRAVSHATQYLIPRNWALNMSPMGKESTAGARPLRSRHLEGYAKKGVCRRYHPTSVA